MPLNMKNINIFTQWKNGSVDVTIKRAINHQMHLAQSGRSTRSALYIINVKIRTNNMNCGKLDGTWKENNQGDHSAQMTLVREWTFAASTKISSKF